MFKSRRSKVFLGLGFIFTVLVIAVLTLFVITPANMRYPKTDHAHFRMQYVFLGQLEDFGAPRYQVDYVKDVCSGALTESPIHFHDEKNQIVHLHWQRVTGGEVLKFYGLNKIGGLDGYMGVKLDDLQKFKFTPIPIHSKSLPQPRPNDKFWVYTGEKDNFKKRDFNDFVSQDLETFFGKNSSVREGNEQNTAGLTLPGSIDVSAHNGVSHGTASESEQHDAKTTKEQASINGKNSSNNISLYEQARKELSQTAAPVKEFSSTAPGNEKIPTEEELKDINNLLGNVVIFVQPDEPANNQVKLRFDNLEPLTKSVCGG
jgi:hypothetical protein